MNTLKYAALAASIVAFVPSAVAGNGPHRMSADYGKPQTAYALKAESAPQTGKTLVVRLVDQANGQAVRGAVSVMRPVYLGLKAYPTIQWVAVPLEHDANGNYVCAGMHHVAGERVVLRGDGPNGSPVWLTLTVQS